MEKRVEIAGHHLSKKNHLSREQRPLKNRSLLKTLTLILRISVVFSKPADKAEKKKRLEATDILVISISTDIHEDTMRSGGSDGKALCRAFSSFFLSLSIVGKAPRSWFAAKYCNQQSMIVTGQARRLRAYAPYPAFSRTSFVTVP